jgi:NAD(P)H dehydrogenase (quinone)
VKCVWRLHLAGRRHRALAVYGPASKVSARVAAALAGVLGRPVQAQAVPRETWGALFRAQGMRDPVPRIQMLDGFNEGWIRFEGADATVRKGTVGVAEVIRSLVD